MTSNSNAGAPALNRAPEPITTDAHGTAFAVRVIEDAAEAALAQIETYCGVIERFARDAEGQGAPFVADRVFDAVGHLEERAHNLTHLLRKRRERCEEIMADSRQRDANAT